MCIYTKNPVDTKIAKIVDSAPATLDTLNELALALNKDQNLTTSITNLIATKAPFINPTLSGTVVGTSRAMVDLATVDDTSDLENQYQLQHRLL